jgi:AcrR family transcriptional regulator
MKQDIINISLAGFLKNGIRKMTVQKLVTPIGISTKTVYKWFDDKEALLKECLIHHYASLLKDFLSRRELYPNAVAALDDIWKQAIETDFGVNKVFYHDLNYYYPALQDLIIRKYDDKISTSVIKLIQWGMDEGYFRKDLQPEIIFETMKVLYSSLTRSDQFRKFRLDPRALAKQTIHIYIRGICTNRGLKELIKIEK